MTIYTMCVDQESGRYVAVSASDPDCKALAWNEAEALADLIKKTPGITVDAVVHIETSGAK